MGRAYKCDRCGKLYDLSTEDEDNYGVCTLKRQAWTADNIEYIPDRKLDLCPDCCNELDEWMNKGKAKENT